MIYNKRQFSKTEDKKVLHKVKKQWVTISLALFMMIGGGAVATHADVSNVENDNSQQAPINIANSSASDSASSANFADSGASHALSASSASVNQGSASSFINDSALSSNYSDATANFNAIIKFRDGQGIYNYVIKGRRNKPILVNGRKLEMKGNRLMVYNTRHQQWVPYQDNSFTRKSIKRLYISNTNVEPHLEFLVDDGDGSYIKCSSNDLINMGIDSSEINPDGTVNVPLSISGYKGEPYTIPSSDLYDPTLYRNFEPASNSPSITVALGEGYRKSKDGLDSGTNDNGNYWLGSNTDDHSHRILKLVARKYFTHVYFTYNGHKYDAGEIGGFNGDSVDIQSMYNNLDSNIKNVLAPDQSRGYQFNQNLGSNQNTSGSHLMPGELDIPLSPNNNITESVPLYIENYKDRNSSNPSSRKLIHVDVYNRKLDQPDNMIISQNSLQNPSNNGAKEALKGNYLVSEGSLTNLEDFNVNGQLVNKWSIGNRPQTIINNNQFVYVGAAYDGNQLVPVIYYRHPAQGGVTDLLQVPDLNFTYRVWKPGSRKPSDLSRYDRLFVNQDVTLDNEYKSQAKSYPDAVDYDNSNQNITWNISGDYAPTGVIYQEDPWTLISNDKSQSHLLGENPGNTNNDWYVQLTRDKNGVHAKFLKAADSGSLATNNGDKIQYLGHADGQNGSNTKQYISNFSGNKSGQTGFIVEYDGQKQWYPKNATILWDENNHGFCSYHFKSKGKNQGGYYTYAGSNQQPISFIVDNSSLQRKSDGSFYLGYMNAYSQPVQYNVKFVNSGNYDNINGQSVADRNLYPQNNNGSYNNYTQSMNNNNLTGYAGDTIYYKNGAFYLVSPTNDGNDEQLLTMPTYKSSDAMQRKIHRLMYDQKYEQSYLDQLFDHEKLEGHYIKNRPDATNPSWTLGVGNLPLNIWPDGTNLDDNDNTAVIYTSSSQIQALNRIAFVDLDTGDQFTNSLDHNGQNINTLFNNDKITDGKNSFDVGDFLSKIESETNSQLQEDRTWKLSTPLTTKNGHKDLYIIRTDSPGKIEPINDTFIYVCSIDINDPRNWGRNFPLHIQYVNQDNPSDPVPKKHDFTVQGGLNTDTIDNVLSNGSLWDYANKNQGGYQEVGIIRGNYEPGVLMDTTSLGNVKDSSTFNKEKLFGTTSYVTIVIKKPVPQGEHSFTLNFIDANNPNNNLSSLDVYSTGSESSAVPSMANSYIANTMNSLINNDHYSASTYTSNGSSTSNFSSLEASDCKYTNSNQNVDIYLNHTYASSSVQKSVGEEIDYYKADDRGIFSNSFSEYSNTAAFSHPATVDQVTGSASLNSDVNWKLADGGFNNITSPRFSNYTPDLSVIDRPVINLSNSSIGISAPGANRSVVNNIPTYTYKVRYYPSYEILPVTERINYIVQDNHRLDPKTYINQVTVVRDLKTDDDRTDGTYFPWHFISRHFIDVKSPKVKGYLADKEIVNKPDINDGSLQPEYDATVYYHKPSAPVKPFVPFRPEPFPYEPPVPSVPSVPGDSKSKKHRLTWKHRFHRSNWDRRVASKQYSKSEILHKDLKPRLYYRQRAEHGKLLQRSVSNYRKVYINAIKQKHHKIDKLPQTGELYRGHELITVILIVLGTMLSILVTKYRKWNK